MSENDFECFATTGVKSPANAMLEHNAEFTREIQSLDRQLREIGAASTTADAFVRFAELALVDMATIWQRANDAQRRRVQTLLFKTALSYSPNTKSLNPGNTPLFRMLEHMNPKNLLLASPTGFEPVLPPWASVVSLVSSPGHWRTSRLLVENPASPAGTLEALLTALTTNRRAAGTQKEGEVEIERYAMSGA